MTEYEKYRDTVLEEIVINMTGVSLAPTEKSKTAIDNLLRKEVEQYVMFYNAKYDTGYSTRIHRDTIDEFFRQLKKHEDRP